MRHLDLIAPPFINSSRPQKMYQQLCQVEVGHTWSLFTEMHIKLPNVKLAQVRVDSNISQNHKSN